MPRYTEVFAKLSSESGDKLPFIYRNLFYLLLQPLKKRRTEKVDDGKLQAVTYLFHRGNRGGIVPSADDIVQRKLSFFSCIFPRGMV